MDLFARCALRGPGTRRASATPMFTTSVLPCPVSASAAWCTPSRTTVSSLPPETLAAVLTALRGDVASLCSCASVSRKWRDVVYTSPQLWTRIDVGKVLPRQARSRVAARLTDDRLLTFLARGGSHVTHLLLQGSWQLTGASLQALEQQRSSLVVLDLTGCMSQHRMPFEQLASLLQSLAGSSLRTLRLSGVRVGFEGQAMKAADLLAAFLQATPGVDVDVNNLCYGPMYEDYCNRLIRIVASGPSAEAYVARRCSMCLMVRCNWCCAFSDEYYPPRDADPVIDFDVRKVIGEAMTEKTCRCGAEFVCGPCTPLRRRLPCALCRKYDCDLCDVTLTQGEQQALCSTQHWQGRTACSRRMCRPCAQTLALPERCGACNAHFCQVCVQQYGELTDGVVPGDDGKPRQGHVCMSCAAQQQPPLRSDCVV